MTLTIQQLRCHAISSSLFQPTTLKRAIRRLGFVQADPIRSPARAQELILRHRVKGYCAGDLERLYRRLDIEEDLLYAYGFMPRRVWRLLHPRNAGALPKLHRNILEIVCKSGSTHPAELEAHFGRKRVINPWGGYSKATTRALEELHYRGLLRISGRDNGIRVYGPVLPCNGEENLPPIERLRKLIMVMASILAPVPQATLQSQIARYRRLGNPRKVLHELINSGELHRDTIDGRMYVWPVNGRGFEESAQVVRFLAPFDPVVWDRSRFEHLWGWPYRFEAYTPPAKRLRGYYAMPMLWRDSVVGWANARIDNGALFVETGFVTAQPRDRAFRRELDAEVERLRLFLNLDAEDQSGDRWMNLQIAGANRWSNPF